MCMPSHVLCLVILPSPVRDYTPEDLQHPTKEPGSYDPNNPTPDLNTRLAFQHNNDGEDAVIQDLVRESPPLSPSAMPWKNKLQQSFVEDNSAEFVPPTDRLIDLEKMQIPQIRHKRSASMPHLKRGAMDSSEEDSSEEEDPMKLLQKTFKLPGHGYFDRQLNLPKTVVKKVTLFEQAKISAMSDSDVKSKLAEMLGKLSWLMF